jgi:hypothetical protein
LASTTPYLTPISFTYQPMAFVGHYPPQPGLYLTRPYPMTLLPNGSGYCSSQTSSRIHPNIYQPSSFYTHLLTCEDEQTECSETSAFKTQTLGNYPKEIIQYLLLFFHSATQWDVLYKHPSSYLGQWLLTMLKTQKKTHR